MGRLGRATGACGAGAVFSSAIAEFSRGSCQLARLAWQGRDGGCCDVVVGVVVVVVSPARRFVSLGMGAARARPLDLFETACTTIAPQLSCPRAL